MHWRWLLSQLLTAPTRRPGQSHVLIPASRTERLVIVHCSSLSRVFSEPMTSFECIKPTKETFERLTAPLASREGCARGGGRRRTPDPQRRDGVIALHCSSSPEPHRPPARAGSFDAASRSLGCGHLRDECDVGFSANAEAWNQGGSHQSVAGGPKPSLTTTIIDPPPVVFRP